MRRISVEKVTLNIGAGMPGEKLDKAVKLLTKISGRKPVVTSSKKRIPTWGLRPGLEIGCKVTVRGGDAVALLQRLLTAVNQTLTRRKFDNFGSFSFGVPEYLSIPGVEYDASIGIIGLEAAVTLQRPGFGIRRRRVQRRPIPQRHRISAEEAVEFMTKEFGVKVA